MANNNSEIRKIAYCNTLGYTAFYYGRFRVPCLDKKFMAIVRSIPSGTDPSQFMNAWFKGWDEARNNKWLKDQWLRNR
jgi:hypothetical protein